MASEERLRELEEKYEDYTVYDNRGSKIGKVDDLFVDEKDNEEYIGVKMGFFGRKSTLIPTEIVRINESDRTIEVAESKDHVKDAPSFDDDEDVTSEYEERIRRPFGLESLQAGPAVLPAPPPAAPPPAPRPRTTTKAGSTAPPDTRPATESTSPPAAAPATTPTPAGANRRARLIRTTAGPPRGPTPGTRSIGTPVPPRPGPELPRDLPAPDTTSRPAARGAPRSGAKRPVLRG